MSFSIRSFVSPQRVFFAAVFGLIVSAYLLYSNWDSQVFEYLKPGKTMLLGLMAAALCMVLRDLFYMIRIRVLTGEELSWRQSFSIILLWEFASAVTPSIVGGTAFAFFLLKREGIGLGKTTAIVFSTAFLDELFFILAVPFFILFSGYSEMFSVFKDSEGFQTSFGMGLEYAFWSGYVILFCYTLFLFIGLFHISEKKLKKVFSGIFSIPFIGKWKSSAISLAEEISLASKTLKKEGPHFWAKAFGATVCSWGARYLVINFLLLAFRETVVLDHIVIFSRQIFMWVIMLITPTPGGSGMAEVLFSGFLSEFVEGADLTLSNVLGFVWRLFSYYPYLFIGIILFARWINKKSR